jgi:hypothetical protein
LPARNDGVPNFGNTPLSGHSPTYTSFDAPGARTGAFQGTNPGGMNPSGAITGYYVDASNVIHGFLVVGEEAQMIANNQ